MHKGETMDIKQAMALKNRIDSVELVLRDMEENNSPLKIGSVLSKTIQFEDYHDGEELSLQRQLDVFTYNYVKELLEKYRDKLSEHLAEL